MTLLYLTHSKLKQPEHWIALAYYYFAIVTKQYQHAQVLYLI